MLFRMEGREELERREHFIGLFAARLRALSDPTERDFYRVMGQLLPARGTDPDAILISSLTWPEVRNMVVDGVSLESGDGASPERTPVVPRQRIAERAYEIWQSDESGTPEENWIRAERELHGEPAP
jgi:hypothetical protein